MGTQLQHERTSKPRKSQAPKPVPEGRRWLKVPEAASLLGLSIYHTYKLHRQGKLPSFRLPGMGVRVDRTRLEEKFQALIQTRTGNSDIRW
ncbi:MAG: helix-turn-helix domain-containing protein [Candidatus Aminicenantes bacterium]|nr:helix-turn-helix domain-containing protein [Candidatus Aminicenantes bacterium]